ncbi:MAG: hypothetical protein Q4G08_09560 [Capnocytophaga sp.]|nr:hypothetical protein [Capnocytophaga sp.]
MEQRILQNYADKLKKNIPGFISVTVISVADGSTLAYSSHETFTENQLAATFQLEVIREVERGFEFVDSIERKKIDHAIIMVENQIQLVFMMVNRYFLSHILVDATKSNLALTRKFHDDFHQQAMQELIDALGGEAAASLHPLFSEMEYLD